MDERLVRMRRCFQPRQWFTEDNHPDPFTLNEEEMFMWVYRATRECTDGGFEVGYYAPDGTWYQDGLYDSRELAAARVRFLNGGNEKK